MSVIALDDSTRVTAPAPLKLTSRGRRVFGALLAVPVIVGIGVFGMWGTAAIAGSSTPAQLSYVTVYSGDSLWSIAADVTAPGADVRDTLAEIQSLNGLTSTALTPGQQIAVPAH